MALVLPTGTQAFRRYVGGGTSAGGAPTPPPALVAHPVVGGLVDPNPRSLDGFGTYRPTPPPALALSSFTSTPQGGAPGAQFGPPGVGSAPVPQVGGIAITPGLLIGLALVAGAVYLVTRS